MPPSIGYIVERRVRQLAAFLGVPEFVYSVPLVSKGSSVREVGDGILLCGLSGAVLQVKARSRHEGLRDSEDSAVRWVSKHVERAVRQGRGSKRTIVAHFSEGDPLTAVPVRALSLGGADRGAFRVSIDTDCAEWPIIVVVAHPLDPEVMLPVYDDAFCISLNDWHQLNRHLRSIHELLRYIGRVLEGGQDVTVPLGHESYRFASLVEWDTAYAAQDKGARPWVSCAAIEDQVGVDAYRVLLDRTWGDNDVLPDMSIKDYRPILDFLDDVPAIGQAHVGRWILDRRAELHSCRHRVSGSTLLNDRPLVFMCDLVENHADRQSWISHLGGLTSLRAAEWREQMRDRKPVLGIGIRIMGEHDEYSYLLADSYVKIPASLRRALEWRFGVANFRAFQTRRLIVGRNDPCPCGSGRKYKRCHGSSPS